MIKLRVAFFGALLLAAGMFAAPVAHADAEMDDWCSNLFLSSGKILSSSVVMCSDPILRELAAERTHALAGARQRLDPVVYKELLADHSRWVQIYSALCGIDNNKPVPNPITAGVIACFRREGEARVIYMRGYGLVPQVGPTPAGPDAEARAKKYQEEQTELERQGRDSLHEQAKKESQVQLARKLNDRGYRLVTPVDLALDWRELAAASTKIALQGIYENSSDIDGLLVPYKDEPFIRLFAEGASRDARKAMLECRESAFTPSKCRMMIAGVVRSCTRNKGLINEKEVPCLGVEEGFVILVDVNMSSNTIGASTRDA
jgi:hypothetical protein